MNHATFANNGFEVIHMFSCKLKNIKVSLKVGVLVLETVR
jgi:hypothetical protein